MVSSPFGDFVGWCLAFVLPALVMLGPLRRDTGVAHAYLFTVMLHIAAAAIYFYVPGVLPTRGDAHGFSNYAAMRQWATEPSFGIGSRLYEECLAQVYSLFGSSFFLGAILSTYAFVLSVLVLVKLIELLNIQQGKGLIVLLFGALPTSVLYGSVPLREPYQILFFMLACYSMLRFRLSSRPVHLLAAILFAVMMGLLHKGLILYAPFLILMMLLVRVDHPGSRSSVKVYFHRFAAVALAAGFVAGMSAAAPMLQEISGTNVLLSATVGGDVVDYATQHRDRLSEHRTSYGVSLDTSSPFRLLFSTVAVLFHYMFTPFPWQIGNSLDLYAFGEVAVRIGCLVAIFRTWRRGGPVHPQIVTLLMVVYISMALLWAAGTTNWGTATRHHMVHQWILLLLGVPALIQIMPGFFGGRTAPQAGTPRSSGPRAARVEPRIPHLRSLTGTATPPPRLGAGGRSTRDREITDAVPRVLAKGSGRPRRLTDK